MKETKVFPDLSGYSSEDWPAMVPNFIFTEVVDREYAGISKPFTYNPSAEFLDWAYQLDADSKVRLVDEISKREISLLEIPRKSKQNLLRKVLDTSLPTEQEIINQLFEPRGLQKTN